MMDEGKIIINMQGGSVITGGTFSNVEFVANKYVMAAEKGRRDRYEEAEEVQEAHDEAVQAVSKPRTGGRKPESLFKDRKGERDEERTRAKASDFVGYLKKQGLLGMTIDTRRDNETNKAFVEFYQRWVDEENVSSYPNGSACYRFLKEDCALQMASEENGYMKTYGEFIRKMILDA